MGFRETRKKGRLEVIAGCMRSGKTEELIRRLERLRIGGVPFVLVKPVLDTRWSAETVRSHNGREIPISCRLEQGQETIERLSSLLEDGELSAADTVAFDEGNFFSKELIPLVKRLVSTKKRVVVAGLDMTFAGEPFGPMPDLLALADQVDKLHAVCNKCGEEDAVYTQRLVGGKPASPDGPVILVGDAEYESRCRLCWEKG